MKPILFVCSLSLLFLTFTTVVDADLARPKQSPQVNEGRIVLHTGLEIGPDMKLSEARLQIPQSQLQALRAALDSAAGNTTVAASVSQNSTRTIIAGLLLFVSLSFAGVWLARSRNKVGLGRTRKAIGAAVILVATIGAAAIITRGNAGPPPYRSWRNLPKALSDGRSSVGGLNIEVVPDDPNQPLRLKLLLPYRKDNQGGE